MSLNKPIITKADFVASVADALQFMSYYHPVDFIQALGHAYEHEQSAAAKDAIAQISFSLCQASPHHVKSLPSSVMAADVPLPQLSLKPGVCSPPKTGDVIILPASVHHSTRIGDAA